MTANIITTQQAQILTVVPTLNLGEIQISADRRSTKEAKLSDAERIRRIVLPANHWGELAATINSEKSQGLTDILREGLKAIAADRLRDTLAENPMVNLVELADYSVASLLKWSTETASSRGSITFTRDQALEWFKGSKTISNIKDKHGSKADAVIAFLTNRIGALAAKNHGLKTEAEALKLMTLIDAADTESAMGVEIISRLDAISKQLKAKEAESTISLDDL